ncbi:MAG: hypothetical protein PHY38_01080 [Bacilli bacterium]|nr:hypothetical protein [Bacilli bacterium]
MKAKLEKIYPVLVGLVSLVSLLPLIVYAIDKFSQIFVILITVSILLLGFYLLNQTFGKSLDKRAKSILDLVLLITGFIINIFLLASLKRYFYYEILLYFCLVTLVIKIATVVLEIFGLRKVNYFILLITPLVLGLVYAILYISKYEFKYFTSYLYLLTPLIFWFSTSLYTLLFFKGKEDKGMVLLGMASYALLLVILFEVLLFEYYILG